MIETHRKPQVLPWIVWATAGAYVLFDAVQQMAPGELGPELCKEFQRTEAILGTISAFYFYAYAVMQIPVGVITDHFGPRRPLVVAAVIAVIGTLLFSISWSIASAEMSRMLVGAGAAFAYVGCLKLVSNWFPASRFATMVGLTNLVGMAGAMVGAAPVADAVTHLGWRGTSVIFAAVGGGLAVLIWLVVRDHPRGAVRWDDHPEHRRGKAKTLQDAKHVLGKRQFWIIGLYVMTMNITFAAFGAVWGTSFIQKAYNISEVDAATAVSMLFLGGLMGGPFFGWFSDRIQRRKLPMIISSVGALVVMLIILYLPGLPRLPLPVIYPLLILQGFCCMGVVLGFAVGHDMRPPGSAGISVGFVNTCVAGGTAIFLPIMGWLLAMKHPEKAALGLSALPVEDFRFGLTFLLVCLGVAVFAALLCRETHCQSLYDKR